MKKITALIFSFVLLLFMIGCQKESHFSDDINPPPSDSTILNADADASEPMPTGTVEIFTYKNLTLEISNVCEKRIDTGIYDYDNGDSYEFPVYTCYPGATLSIIDADMSDPTCAEDHQPHPQWGMYDVETDTRTKLTDGMEPIVLDETTDAVFNLEASVFVLKFEFVE